MVTKDRAFLFESVIQARMRRLAPLGSLSRLRAGLLHMTFQNPICATLESQRASEGNFRIQLGPFGWEKNRKIPYAIPLPASGRGAAVPAATSRHCERSEAIQRSGKTITGLLRRYRSSQ